MMGAMHLRGKRLVPGLWVKLMSAEARSEHLLNTYCIPDTDLHGICLISLDLTIPEKPT